MFVSSANSAVLPSNYTFTDADKGVHTFTGLVLKKKGSQIIIAFDASSPLILGALGLEVV
jgi:hypothetical protein